MPELQRLRADHAPAVLAFELANRAYFAASISDRGDDFYEQFSERHHAMLAEQEAGTNAFYVLVGDEAPYSAGSTCSTLKTARLSSATGSHSTSPVAVWPP